MKLYEKLSEMKVLRDPIHGYIHIEDKIIWDILKCKEVQRLRRIKQLGSSFVVYHTAEHSRFSHSLGVYEITRRMCDEIKNLKLTQFEKIVVMLAALLHDIGHGPFSHSFESVSGISHEVFTCRILLEDSQVHTCLESYYKGLSNEVASVISHTHPNPLLQQMISGQLDADRMDYLLRDAYFTGTKYGEFDLERIIRTMRVKDNQLVVKASGVHSIEDYIMARYHMYWQVYYHPVSRAFEAVLLGLFTRMRDLLKKDPHYFDAFPIFNAYLMKKEVSLENHYLLDECTAYYTFQLLSQDNDKILSDLARRIIQRDLFGYIDDIGKDCVKEIEAACQAHDFIPKYYCHTDNVKQKLYMPFSEEAGSIWLLKANDEIIELSKGSHIVSSVIAGKKLVDHKVFYPKDVQKN